MLIKSFLPVVFLATNVTSEPVQPCVLRNVILQTLSSREQLCTVFTRVAFSFMLPHVVLVVARVSKSPSALTAVKRKFPRVKLHVLLQGCCAGERLVAHITVKTLLFRSRLRILSLIFRHLQKNILNRLCICRRQPEKRLSARTT